MKHLLLCCLLAGYTVTGFATEKIRVIIPFAPSGATSVLAQTWINQLNPVLKSSNLEMIPEFAPGAGGKIANSKLLGSGNKNLVMMFTSNQIVVNSVYDRADWTMNKDIIPVAYGGTTPMIIVASKKSGLQTFKDIVTNKDNKKISFGHSGEGSANWLATVTVQNSLRGSFNLIGYKGNAPALQDLLGGHLDVMIDFYSTALPHIQGGTITAVTILWDRRLADLSSTTTWTDLTQQSFLTPVWWGFFANNSQDKEKLVLVKQAIESAQKDKKFVEKLQTQGYWVKPMDFSEYVNQQMLTIRQLNLPAKS